MDCTCTITARHLRHTECNAHNTQQLVSRALDGLHKSCLSRNVRVLWLLASSRNTILPHKDMVSHLIWMTLCKAASMEMRWDCIPPGTTRALRALRSLSTLLPSSLFSELHVLSSQNCTWIWIKTKFQVKSIFAYLYKTNNTGLADQPFHFSLSRAIQATFQCSQTCGC